MNRLTLMLAATLLALPGAPTAGEETPAHTPEAPAPASAPVELIELDPTTISGHRELPRVMHVVPWKRALPADLHGRPVNTLLEDVLAPVDRDEFRRQLRYHNALINNPPENPGD